MQRAIVSAILGVALAVGLVLYLVVRRVGSMPGPSVWIALAALVGGGVTVVVFAVARAARSAGARGTEAVAAAAERLGLGYRAADKELRARFRDLPEVTGNAGIKHVLEGDLDGRGLIAFQSSYMVSTGQTMIQVVNTIFAVAGPDWPVTHVTPRGGLGRLFARLGVNRGLQLENPEFNARFAVKAADEEFAIALLGPDMQAFLLTHVRARWRIGAGRVCLTYAGSLKPDRLDASLDRLRGFWSRVPPELEAW